jgi:predicted PurR-regulated permease PerM
LFELTQRQKRLLTWAGLAVLVVLAIWLLAPVLTPFVVAACLAYALHPAVEALVTRRVPRVVAVVLVEAIAILAILAVLLLLVPILSKQIPLLRDQIPVLAAKINAGLMPLLQRLGVEVSLDVASIRAFVVEHLGSNAEEIVGSVLSSARIGGSVLLALVGNAVLIPVVLFFVLMDWPSIVRRVSELVPPRLRTDVQGFFDECDNLLGQYMRGQLLVMLALSAFYSIGLALFGFSLALPVGVFTGMAVFIPYLGFGLGGALALLAGLLQFPGSWWGVGAVIIVYGAGQLLESFVLTPRLVGERIGLSPLAVIFALLAFGQLFGFIGVLIALPASAVVSVALRRARRAYLHSDVFTHGPQVGTTPPLP